MDRGPTLFLITGIMAAGKPTTAQALAERFDRSAHVRGDTFRRFVVSGRSEMSSSPSDEAIEQLRLRYRREAQRSKIGYTTFTPLDMHDALQQRTPRLGLWIDTTEMSVEQTVDDILERQDEAIVN